jgi:hypothetical protein
MKIKIFNYNGYVFLKIQICLFKMRKIFIHLIFEKYIKMNFCIKYNFFFENKILYFH